MSNDRYTDDELKEKFGMRGGGTALFGPQELGYRCPNGHADLTWSEFNEHIWCYKCEKDYHYADDCVLIKDEFNPKGLPKQSRIIEGIDNWNESGDYCNDIPPELLKKGDDDNGRQRRSVNSIDRR
jgi:hypothetical protein